MGKRTRKTRWRTLSIADEHSDSEESNSTQGITKTYQQKSYLSKFSYSSQSTPRRRYQYDSTRSSSTTSENKITFNEDEYTRITTPRQDVLFKKGYLNKPKSYQTQTSTGNSTTSTGNSTGNGTPDYQSTDLEYESQFVFPNGFVDQNGIYYVNSYEPYPLMLFNPPTYYPECSNIKSKRYSTGSLTESMSPNNEEATSQDLSQSGGEASTNLSDYPVYNMVYPGYYVNGVCPPQEIVNGHCPNEPRRMKRRRRRKSTKTSAAATQNDSTSEYTEDESCEEGDKTQKLPPPPPPHSVSNASTCTSPNSELSKQDREESEDDTGKKEEKTEDAPKQEETIEENRLTDECDAAQEQKPKYDLKPDAEEFVPRAYRPHEFHVPPGLQFIKLPPNFVPVPLLPSPIGEFGNPGFNHAFIPAGFPAYPPNVVGFIPPPFIQKSDDQTEATEQEIGEDNSANATEAAVADKIETNVKQQNALDLKQIVSKLEEAVKEQEESKELEKQKESSPVRTNKQFHRNNRFRNYIEKNHKRVNNYKKEEQNSNEDKIENPRRDYRQSPEKFRKNWKQSPKKLPNGDVANDSFVKEDKFKPYSNKNYSEMLKREQKSPYKKQNARYERQSSVEKTAEPVKVEAKVATNPKTPVQLLPNQWISVSSKKKRKNRNMEETEEVMQNGLEEEDLFESYDVSLLEDVVPPTTEEAVAETEPIKTEELENILTNIAQNEVANLENNVVVESIPEVSEIEKELIKVEEEVVAVEAQEPVVVNVLEKEESKKSKKKSKKGTQKPLTKRVIITDVDLSEKVVEQAEPAVKEKVETNPKKAEAKEDSAPITEKKNKKKKKKSAKPALSNSLSSSDNALNSIDESYDFLLENSVLEESTEKTNVEVYQELDKMIQKGMYSNLEVKMKSLNIEKNDEFFKSVIDDIVTKEAGSCDNNLVTKAPDFTKILQSTRKLYTNPVSVDHRSAISMDINTVSLPALDVPAATDGFFLESSELDPQEDHHQPLPDTDTANDESPEATPDNSTVLYPITEAVKQWMQETREKTPEVEILKSPTTIYKELCADNSDIETLSEVESNPDDLDEVTLFSKETATAVKESDLLEYWDDEMCAATDQTKDCSCAKCDDGSNTAVEQGEDVLEVYESKYGKNEDFLQLQREVKEKQKSSGLPKHGNLPYRAICCELM